MLRICLIRFLSAIGLLLVGCSVLRVEPELPPSSIDRQALAQIDSWELLGRIAIRVADESWHASFEWSHDFVEDHLKLSGPFGQGAVKLLIAKNFIRILYADGRIEESNDPNQLLTSLLGVEVPIEALRYWVLGLAYPRSEFTEKFDGSGWLRSLHQLNWHIEMVEYQQVNEIALPRKIKIRKNNARVIIVIDEWTIQP